MGRAQKDTTVTVLICDDNQSVRTTLSRALKLKKGISVLAELESFEQLQGSLNDLKPDVILLDVNMATTSGVQGLTELRKCGITIPVIIMSADGRNQEPALTAGAAAFFYKGSTNMRELIDSIMSAARTPD